MAKNTNPRPAGRALVRSAADRKPRAVRKVAAAADAPVPERHEVAGDEITSDEIASRAYELFLAEGCGTGRDVDHWLRAERELTQRRLTSAA